MSQELREALAAATAGTETAIDSPPARYALLVRSSDDVQRKAAEVQSAIGPLGGVVRRLSALEPRVLAAEFPDRVFGDNPSLVFAAAYMMRDLFRLEDAEPDLPTNFFPEGDPLPGQKDLASESLGGLCFTPEQPDLDVRWALAAMRIPDAWAFSDRQGRPSRGEGIVIAQPDTGVTEHPELRDVLQQSPRDVLDQDHDPTDPLEDIGNPGHGTATGSVVVSPGSGRVTGAAPRAVHMPIRAIRSVVRITQVSVAEAMDWAVDKGAHVISMSLGGIFSFSLHRALRRAVEANVIVLAAAGNCVRLVVWPARYDDCIAVAAVNNADQPWKGTCRGAAVDVSAPGENVFRARIGDPAVGQGQGTSFAVALTAGVAALWLAHHGRDQAIAAAQARGENLQSMFLRLLRATARRPHGWDFSEMGGGVVDAVALLQAGFDASPGPEAALRLVPAGLPGEASVQSLVRETLGERVIAPGLDWRKFGAEISAAILRGRIEAPRSEGLRPAAFAGVTAALSPQLAADPAAAPLVRRLREGF
jgi:serine protease